MAEGSAGTVLNPSVLLKETVQTHRRLKLIFILSSEVNGKKKLRKSAREVGDKNTAREVGDNTTARADGGINTYLSLRSGCKT